MGRCVYSINSLLLYVLHFPRNKVHSFHEIVCTPCPDGKNHYFTLTIIFLFNVTILYYLKGILTVKKNDGLQE